MDTQQQTNYDRIALAIGYLRQHFKSQPSLEEVAGIVQLSPHHFQRLFTEWAGTSPKRFLQYTSIAYAKGLLQGGQTTLFEVAHETGLSGTGRLHDLFVNIEGMTPAAYKNGGKELVINYSWESSPFGNVLLGSTTRGICHMAFSEEETQGLQALFSKFPKATFVNQQDSFQQSALSIFQKDKTQIEEIKLHLKGTAFQLKVWEALLTIPMGSLSTYSRIAKTIGSAGAARAVGTAIGSNPVAFLIPCHRVIQSNGSLGGYMWGLNRKTAMIGWEAAQRELIASPDHRP